MARIMYQQLARLVGAFKNGGQHEETIERLVRDVMPSGSGFDSGTKIDLDASSAEKLVFRTSYHHMNDGGFYDGWTEHVVTVKPSLQFSYVMTISGRDRNQTRDYMYECFDQALRQDVEYLQLSYVFDVSIIAVWDKDGCQIASWTPVVNGIEMPATCLTCELAERACIAAIR